MSESASRPDVGAVLSRLKDFQLRSVDYTFRRLYGDPDATRRFLVADEAGLGKTLVARGVVARVVDHLWDSGRRIDVVYICSNANIASQNVNRLKIGEAFTRVRRLTLLPTELTNLAARRLNFVAITPGTSFAHATNLGTKEERALLYWMLKKVWNLEGTGPLNLLQGNASKEGFRSMIGSFLDHHTIDQTLAGSFAASLQREAADRLQEGRPDLRTRFAELSHRFRYARKHIPLAERAARNLVVGELRAILAATCIMGLEPDLVILDEFQRFKHLLRGDNDAGLLAQQLFRWPECRILLLSATPYKMYCLEHEAETDNHYRDFVDTLNFLEGDEARRAELEGVLREYRRAMYLLGNGEGEETLGRVKGDLERRLRRLMVRTERLAASPDRNGMLETADPGPLRVETGDVRGFVALQRIGRLLATGDTLEYWKAAPYLLNFMDDYKLKREFSDGIRGPRGAELGRQLASAGEMLLSWEDVLRYSAIDPGNARLRALARDTVDSGAWRLVWVPPSLPYYRSGGPYAEYAHPEGRSFTKRLVFSSWQVVPKVIAALLSYEAERLMLRSFEENPDYTREARQRRPRLLRFDHRDGRLTGMPVLGLLYPSLTLAREVDPLTLTPPDGSAPASLDEVLSAVRNKVEQLLAPIRAGADADGQEDDSWYWAAPVLLDEAHYPQLARRWLERRDLAATWAGGDVEAGDEEGQTGWLLHVDQMRRLLRGEIELKRPPADLGLVLARNALAGPGVAALRALMRVSPMPSESTLDEVRDVAARVAWTFRSLFNLPEVTAMIRGLDAPEPYWRQVLEYCVHGNLQSVLDEYVHVLRESLGLFDKAQVDTARELGKAICQAVGLRTVTVGVDDIGADGSGGTVTLEPRRMRARFALRFGADRSEDGSYDTRPGQVREAFNSPFWPFVLATTSVGQEGLDFHPYCHVVVHWNLPSNPVDLEQREGRIHRYKGHAVRKNLAWRYGGDVLGGSGDPWEAMFALGVQDRQPEDGDLVPFWVCVLEGGARIERHVPAVPLSREVERLESLRRSLAVYRMVFGQPRQEELLTYLLDRLPEGKVHDLVTWSAINLSPGGSGCEAAAGGGAEE